MSARIVRLWAQGLAPGWDGLYRADGSAYAVELDGAARLDRFDVGSPLDLEAILAADPEQVTNIDIRRGVDLRLPDGLGYACGGEGSHGSEGFFARLDNNRNLVWIVMLTDSNPFVMVRVRGALATFTNNLGNSITVDLHRPEFR